jgi:hypothetical protein
MKERCVSFGVGVLFALTVSSTMVTADVIVLDPIQGTVLPADSTGLTRVAVYFDSAPLDSSMQVEEAALLWNLDGEPLDAVYDFSVYELLGSIAAEGTGAGPIPADLNASLDSWLVGPQTNEENQTVIVRLGLKNLVQAWAKGLRPNYGVLVETPNVAGEVFSSQLPHAKLKIWYSR